EIRRNPSVVNPSFVASSIDAGGRMKLFLGHIDDGESLRFNGVTFLSANEVLTATGRARLPRIPSPGSKIR
ncbi:MAG: hypothetical protein ABI414_04005, partial [Devosia sp.]